MLTVGALGEKTNEAASFTSKGPGTFGNAKQKPELSAPGTNIISASGRGDTFVKKSGTSMSTPNIAGVISLLWSAVPALDRDIEKTNQILFDTALKQTSRECSSPQGTPNYVFGHGTVNVAAAYERAVKLYGSN